ncbi:hypothetical protein EW145_g2246 [Phellinidium pouzarii]|uniref:RNA polymerase II-associated protein 1 C-terminal domain-containing protein n=1 Tax=Phellinidium pouzarii TaxID=167371 RepID=A0A4S4LDA9_9AGAM|nr:hypothetical protein EW145_g2246 [Phellinidium pouzarii]
MAQPPLQLVGPVFERPAYSRPSFSVARTAPSSGFPSVQHRSKSAFARAREAKRNRSEDTQTQRRRDVPSVQKSGMLLAENQDHVKQVDEPLEITNKALKSQSSPQSQSESTSEDKWIAQMKRDNDRAIEAMTEEEREQHRSEILEQLGPNIEELLRNARETRVAKQAENDALRSQTEHVGVNGEDAQEKHGDDNDVLQPTPSRPQSYSKELVSHPRGILVTNSPPDSRSSTPGKATRKLRFAEVTPNDVHIFQSEPSSPRRPIGLLPPPPSQRSDEGASVETIEDISESRSGTLTSTVEPEEGTPEDIRRRFFPHLLPNDPTLEWIEAGDLLEQGNSDSEPRFDLTGAPISLAQRASLPTHLGLHHHGGPAAAGYTLKDLLLLARSSVPAQRATVLGVLAKIVRRLAHREPEVAELSNRENIRSKALAVGLVALIEKGSLGVQAVDLVWTCIVLWDKEFVDGLEGVELRPLNPKTIQHEEDEDEDENGSLSSTDILSSLPFSVLLPQIAAHLHVPNLPPESLSQLLAISHRLARHSVAIATAISETPQFVANIVRTFLLTPIPPVEGRPLPDPLSLQLLHTLVLSSRTVARSLEGPVDALLRFVITSTPLSASPFPRPLAEALLRKTLEIYAALARYGIYSSVATTAVEHFGRFSVHVFSDAEVSDGLKVTWLNLQSEWMVCARDPHRTTPTHDLLWSQVLGWTWGDELLSYRRSLITKGSNTEARVWSALWGSLAVWLEGCRVNSAKAGQDEHDAVNTAVAETWNLCPQGGPEKVAVKSMVASLRQELSIWPVKDCTFQEWKGHLVTIAELTQTLSEFTRFALACAHMRTPDPAGTVKAETPSVVTIPWILDAFSILSPVVREVISNCIWEQDYNKSDHYDLSARILSLHLRSASAFLALYIRLSHVLSSGDEWCPLGAVVLERLLPGDEESAQWLVNEIIKFEGSRTYSRIKLTLLEPFFKYTIRPDEDIYMVPRSTTPQSIQLCTTQCFPADHLPSAASRRARFGLPLSRDWPCVALDHLLRSGTSPVLTNSDSVPDSWNASETELVQASLILLKHLQDRINSSYFQQFAVGLEHMAFVCMKVIMLEHNQQQSDSIEEVFRDQYVGQLMDDLLRPFSYEKSRWSNRPTTVPPNLEDVSKGFLGSGTPFYQFYTDFVALYDAISFSHRTFARLLLLPASMSYALDYRKHLWGDFGHVLRTIQTPIDDVLVHDFDSYLWPFETDAEMIGWYLRALIKWPLDGFVRFLAIHHVSCNIWSDLREGCGFVRESRARMLLLAVINQAKTDVVKDVVCYAQIRGSNVRLPPDCFGCDGDRKAARLAYVREWGVVQAVGTVEKIFFEN